MEASDGNVLLSARYSYSGLVDSSALLKLDADELDRWRVQGRPFIEKLAREISDHYVTLRSEPQVYSEWWHRDLCRSDDGELWRSAEWEAIQAFPEWAEWRAKQ